MYQWNEVHNIFLLQQKKSPWTHAMLQSFWLHCNLDAPSSKMGSVRVRALTSETRFARIATSIWKQDASLSKWQTHPQ